MSIFRNKAIEIEEISLKAHTRLGCLTFDFTGIFTQQRLRKILLINWTFLFKFGDEFLNILEFQTVVSQIHEPISWSRRNFSCVIYLFLKYLGTQHPAVMP